MALGSWDSCVASAGPLSVSEPKSPFLQNRDARSSLPGGKERQAPSGLPARALGTRTGPREDTVGDEAAGGRHRAQAVTTGALEKPHHGRHSRPRPTEISAAACPRAASPADSWPSPPSTPALGGRRRAGEAGPCSGREGGWASRSQGAPLWLAVPVLELRPKSQLPAW